MAKSKTKTSAPKSADNAGKQTAKPSSNTSKPKKAPKPPNTGAFAYFDKKVPTSCAQDKINIDEACQPETEKVKQERLEKKPGLLGKLKFPPKTPQDKNVPSEKRWIGDHCDLLMIKPSSTNDMLKQFKKIESDVADLLGAKLRDKILEEAKDALTKAIAKKVGEIAAKQVTLRVVSFFGGPIVGIAVNAALTISAANDVRNAIKSFPEMAEKVKTAVQAIEHHKKQIGDLQAQLDKYIYKTGPKKGQLNEYALVSDMMYGVAESNPCIQARRCSLVQYDNVENKDGSGCCPGQTGHHPMPGAMFKGCKSYDHDKALTICVEGVNQYHGSHGVAHTALEKELQNIRHDGNIVGYGETITKDEAMNAAADSIVAAFPLSGCSKNCIKDQLRKNYANVKCEPKNMSGLPDPAPKPSVKPKPKPRIGR